MGEPAVSECCTFVDLFRAERDSHYHINHIKHINQVSRELALLATRQTFVKQLLSTVEKEVLRRTTNDPR